MMVNRKTILAALLLLVVAASAPVMTGCGEKIAIPEPEGQWSIAAYTVDRDGVFEDPDGPVQLTQRDGQLFVLYSDKVVKRNQSYGMEAESIPIDQGTALCADAAGNPVIFIWEEGLKRVSWFDTQDLIRLGSTEIPGIASVTNMATNASGIELVPGAATFLYLSDPAAGLIHRYAFNEYNGLSEYGILSRSNGDAARFVHQPAAMATDYQDSLLVCDLDSDRNWVIRFVCTPDTTDTSPDPDVPSEYRGRATLFDEPSCIPAPAADFVLGKAPGCPPDEWIPGPSDQLGEFDRPSGVAVDASGRIFVADTMNDRIQIFDPLGNFDDTFGNTDFIPNPESITQVLANYEGVSYPAAYVFVLCPSVGRVVKYIDGEYKSATNDNRPPPDPP